MCLQACPRTAVAIRRLASKMGVECPIMESIHAVIHMGVNAQQVVTEVRSREFKVRRGGAGRRAAAGVEDAGRGGGSGMGRGRGLAKR